MGDEGERAERYCFCDSTEERSFMICCDRCGVWYHGDCIQMTQTHANTIENYYCQRCKEQDQTLNIVYKEKHLKILARREERKAWAAAYKAVKHQSADSSRKSQLPRCEQCIGCFRTEDCMKCDACVGERGAVCVKRICVQQAAHSNQQQAAHSNQQQAAHSNQLGRRNAYVDSGEDERMKKVKIEDRKTVMDTNEDLSEMAGNRKRGPKKTFKPKLQRIREMGDRILRARQKRSTHTSKAKSEISKACLGPGCVNSARLPTSKYCSNDCGMKLAEARLALLGQSSQEYWAEEPVSKVLMSLKAVEDDEDEGSDLSVNCAVCALEYPVRQVARHVERCFVRLEKQVTFGTTEKATWNPDELFCDKFNKQNGTYCKRLRVMCPEHYKGDLEAELEVCGCPKRWSGTESLLLQEMFQDGEEGFANQAFCLQPRKSCQLHHRWIQIMMGHLESQRQIILSRMCELANQRLLLTAEESRRGDAILLLCNRTIRHDKVDDRKIKEEEIKVEID